MPRTYDLKNVAIFKVGSGSSKKPEESQEPESNFPGLGYTGVGGPRDDDDDDDDDDVYDDDDDDDDADDDDDPALCTDQHIHTCCTHASFRTPPWSVQRAHDFSLSLSLARCPM